MHMLRRIRAHWPDPVKLDRVLAVGLTVALWLETWLGGNAQGHRVAVMIGGTLTTAAVAFRRRHPELVGIGAAMSSVVMQTFWPSALVMYGIAWICDMYGFAVWARTRTFALTLLAYNASALILAVLPVGAGSLSVESSLKDTIPFLVASTVVMLIVRQVIGTHNRRTEMAERERDLVAREAVVEERARIARELHDVIAHNVSMMVVQAGAERRVLERDGEQLDARGARDGRAHRPQRADRDAAPCSECCGRTAPDSAFATTGARRHPDAREPGARGRPSSRAPGRGRAVASLPAGIELSAYRIVQEALTNALKHAGNARAEVHSATPRNRWSSRSSTTAPPRRRRRPAAHGLVGMRERVALYGGRLDAGRRDRRRLRRFRVKLPVR